MKTIKFLFSTILIVALLTACGSNNSNSSNDPTQSKASNQPGSSSSASASTTLSMIVPPQHSWTYDKGKPIWKAIEEQSGYTIAGLVPPGSTNDYDAALNLTVASGNMPDLLFMNGFTAANKYGQEGALINILDYLEEAPNLKGWLEAHPDIKQRFQDADGNLYVFPNDQGFAEGDRIIWMYREDIFKKNNLKVPQTYDELYDVLKQLKQLYPESYPFGSRGNFNTLTRMAPQFNSFNDMYYDFDKAEWRYGPIEDSYKKLVVFMNKLFKEGLIAPDWLTYDKKKWEDDISNDKLFLTVDYIVMDYYNLPLRGNNADFTLKFMAPPAGFAGANQFNVNQVALDEGMSISSTSKKIKDAMKYMDFFYTDAGKELSTWGIEGVTYEVVNGEKKFLDTFKTMSELREAPGLYNTGTYTQVDYKATFSFIQPESVEAYTEAAKYDSKLQPKPPFTDQQNDVMSTVGEAVKKAMQENITKFILGNRSLDEWDQYVNEVKKLGLDQLIDLYKTAYDNVLQAQ